MQALFNIHRKLIPDRLHPTSGFIVMIWCRVNDQRRQQVRPVTAPAPPSIIDVRPFIWIFYFLNHKVTFCSGRLHLPALPELHCPNDVRKTLPFSLFIPATCQQTYKTKLAPNNSCSNFWPKQNSPPFQSDH